MANGLKQDISIGKNLRKLRKQAGYTQQGLSVQLELMGFLITPEIIAKMEQGRYSVKISLLVALKQLYRLSSFDPFFEGIMLPTEFWKE